MIKAEHLEKTFDKNPALQDVTLEIQEGEVFGLVGTNGAGKSTFLRLVSGIIRPDAGTVTVDEKDTWDNPYTKSSVCFVSDDPYTFPNSTPEDMGRYYKSVYRTFDMKRFYALMDSFCLEERRRINTFSKGMKKQLAILLAICARTKYILLDEALDGLDPVMRQAVKSLLADEMSQRELTPVISSHNLRELEDICEHVGFLHSGGLILSEDLDQLKLDILKVQCVLRDEADERKAFEGLRILQKERQGRLYVLTVRGTAEEIQMRFRQIETIFFEILPLTLEEVFVAETEEAGYDIRKSILH